MNYQTNISDNFPADWEDPLDLYGGLTQDLITSGYDLELERDNVKDLVDKYGARWVWDNRTRLVSMVKSLRETAWEIG